MPNIVRHWRQTEEHFDKDETSCLAKGGTQRTRRPLPDLVEHAKLQGSFRMQRPPGSTKSQDLELSAWRNVVDGFR